jgi:hypothetical protein
MHQIPPHKLWIGGAGDVRDWRRLYDLGIRAVVQVAYEEPPLALPHDILCCRFPLIDGDNDPETLALAIDTLTQCLARKFGCLACCQAGSSRSPAIAGAALSRLTGQSFAACLEEIGTHHRHAIHPKVLLQVQACCDA